MGRRTTEAPDARPLLQVEGLNKSYPNVRANRDVDFDVRVGEVHGLLGENGAGKSTLAECLYGAYRPDSGSIIFDGKPLALSSPRDAIQAGIGMVHQHFALAPALSVLENVIVGTDEGFWLDRDRAASELERLCDTYGVDLDTRARVSELSVGQQQWVEILKALYVGARLLILDEPTAVLTPIETERLFAVLDTMKEGGLSIILITHKLDEVMAVTDRVTVLRRGEVVSTVDTARTDKAELARQMVGRDVVFRIQKAGVERGEPVLEVEDLRVRNDLGLEAVRGASFTVAAGEILAVAGVAGNGQRELFETLVGVRRASSGSVRLQGEEVTNHRPRRRIHQGLANVPEDRIEEGLLLDFPISENLVLGLHRDRPYSRWGVIGNSAIERLSTAAIDEFQILTRSPSERAGVLSGGNMQKVILARELLRSPKCLVVSQATRGLDVGAAEYVQLRLLEQRDRGAAIVLISEDLDEILNVADRIAVMFKGQIVGTMPAEDASLEDLGLLMGGATVGSSSTPRTTSG